MGDLFKGIEPEKSEEDLPDVLKGKSPEEVYRALQQEYLEIKTQDDVEKAKIQAERDALKAQIQNAPQMTAPQMATPQQSDTLLWNDPDTVMQKLKAEMVAPLQEIAGSLRASNRNTFLMQLQQENKMDEWEKYGGEIEQVVNSLHPNAQSRPEAYQAARSYVRGIHADDIIKEKVTASTEETVKAVLEKLGLNDKVSEVIVEDRPQQSLFQRNTGIPYAGGTRRIDLGKLTDSSPVLTKEQHAVAKRFNMTPKEYIEYMEKDDE